MEFEEYKLTELRFAVQGSHLESGQPNEQGRSQWLWREFVYKFKNLKFYLFVSRLVYIRVYIRTAAYLKTGHNKTHTNTAVFMLKCVKFRKQNKIDWKKCNETPWHWNWTFYKSKIYNTNICTIYTNVYICT